MTIDALTAQVLTVVATVYVANERSVPPWVVDALCIAAQDSTLAPDVTRGVLAVLRDAHDIEVMAA